MKSSKRKDAYQRQRPNRKTAKTNARWLAFQALQAFGQRGVFVSKVLDDLFRQHRPDVLDRRLATELANETVRRSLLLDTIVQAFVTRSRQDVEEDLWTILQLGCLQLVCLSHIPKHAAVHETVELCTRIGAVQAKPFVNGVLRNLERSIVDTGQWTDVPPAIDALSARTVPIAQLTGPSLTSRILEFNKDLFADPRESPLEFIAQSTSMPVWLLERLRSQGFETSELFQYGIWTSTPGRMALRVNLMQTDSEKVLDVLKTAQVTAKAGDLPEAIEIEGSINITDLPGYREGWFSVQDVSAMSATELLNPQAGERILDLCAAPGGKTTHLSERLGESGTVVACDTSKRRLKAVKENVARLRLSNVETQIVPEDGSQSPEGPFDAVLVDVPCSNTGVLGKRPEARWRLTPQSFLELIQLQKRLLENAIDLTRSGGRVVYSTCSIDQEENSGILELILSKRPDVRLIENRMHLPGQPGDGAYQALLQKQ